MDQCHDCGNQVESSFKFCPNCGVELGAPKKCPGCGYENESNSKFCQECGRPLTGRTAGPARKTEKAAESPLELDPVPMSGVTIEFPFSSSQTFDLAVQAARALPSFYTEGEGKKAIYRVTVDKTDINMLTDLVENLKGWRNRVVYVDGLKVPWDNVFSFAWCYKRKTASYKPEIYCFGFENDYEFNLWGCIHARLPFHRNSNMWEFGQWIDHRGTWKFDKDRIRHELEKNLFQYRFCPALNPELVEAVLSAIPETVNPTKDRDWDFQEGYGTDTGLPMIVNRYGSREKVWMKAVAPNGTKPIAKIIKALRGRLPPGVEAK